MLIATLSDIHGNLPALEAVFEELVGYDIDTLIVGGDVVAGPQPRECLALLQAYGEKKKVLYVHGNAESEMLAVLAGETNVGFSPRADREARWVADQLTTEEVDFVRSWPTAVHLSLPRWGPTIFCHAVPHNDTTVFTRETTDERLHQIFGPLEASLVVCGHTHMQFERTLGHSRIVNAGSVGLPFGRTGAAWLLLDNEIRLMHTAYDLEEAAARIRETPYPDAEAFAAHNVLQTPSTAAAMQMLRSLEARQAEEDASQ